MLNMSDKTYIEIVLDELHNSLFSVDEHALVDFAGEITQNRRIFCDGAGRSRLQIEGFAMRLVQMGFQAAIVGEPTVPAITKSDILLICSASGETPMMVAHGKKAKSLGAKVLLVTTAETSSLAKLCDKKVIISASSKMDAEKASIQPMGSLFEQSVGILLDSLVLHLMKKYEISNEAMYSNHANLE